MALIGGQFAVPGTATDLVSALGTGVSFPDHVKSLTIKNAKGAANVVYAGGPSVTSTPAHAWVELDANQSHTWYSGEGWLCRPSDIYVVGTSTAANIVFVSIVY